MRKGITMSEMWSRLLISSLAFAVAGGIAYAQWPRPSLVRLVRRIGFVLGTIALTEALCLGYTLWSNAPHSLALLIGGGAQAILWFVAMAITDGLTGNHVFGKLPTRHRGF